MPAIHYCAHRINASVPPLLLLLLLPPLKYNTLVLFAVCVVPSIERASRCAARGTRTPPLAIHIVVAWRGFKRSPIHFVAGV